MRLLTEPTATSFTALDYPIWCHSNAVNDALTWLRVQPECQRVIVITDTTVDALHGDFLREQLDAAGIEASWQVLSANGERGKSWQAVGELITRLESDGVDKQTCLIAFGGGVIGDVVGFVASILLRGIPYIQWPTTLLAMIDSSIGGKSGINTPQGKNRVGRIYFPKAMVADLGLLDTLDAAAFDNGLAELVKILALTCPHTVQRWAKTADSKAWQKEAYSLGMIQQAIMAKCDIVKRDPLEAIGMRHWLNFGHTVGHALEACTEFKVGHGVCVALGMLVETAAMVHAGLCDSDSYDSLAAVLRTLDLPVHILLKYTPDQVYTRARSDKKNQGAQVYMSGLQSLGQPYARPHATLPQDFLVPLTEAAFQAARDEVILSMASPKANV